MNRIKWLYPGMRVKRWLLLSVMGVLLVSFGTAIALGFEFLGFVESSLIHYVYQLTGRIALSINLFVGFMLIIFGVVFLERVIKDNCFIN